MPVRYDADGLVATVTIDRPEVANAIDRPTAEALADAFRRFDQDDAASVAALTGAGGSSARARISRPCRSRAPPGEPGGAGRGRPRRSHPVTLLRKPVIAAVEGDAVAGGLELAIWCDLRVAAEDAVFGVYCRRWGIPLMDGGTIRLARLIGHATPRSARGR